MKTQSISSRTATIASALALSAALAVTDLITERDH
jgi:hypothetical protein